METLHQFSMLPILGQVQVIQAGIALLSAGISGLGFGCILWGLFQMQAAGKRRDKEIDEMGKGLRQQGEMMTEALQGLRQQGQALERQGVAMTQAFTQQGQALTQQGQVLAELLRRTA